MVKPLSKVVVVLVVVTVYRKNDFCHKHKNAVMLQEMQQTMGILNPKQSLPELSEVFTKLFGGASSQTRVNKKVSKVNKPVKKRS